MHSAQFVSTLLHHGCVHLLGGNAVWFKSSTSFISLVSTCTPLTVLYCRGLTSQPSTKIKGKYTSWNSHPSESLFLWFPLFSSATIQSNQALFFTLGHHQPPPHRALTASCSRAQGDVGMWGTETKNGGELFLQGGRGA